MLPATDLVAFHGLEALRLTGADGATVIVSRHGAQVLSWKTADGVEQLFLSERAGFGGGATIRGGVPVCFPQFSGMGLLPKHGLVRTMLWTPAPQQASDDGVKARLAVTNTPKTLALWPHRFRCELEVRLSGGRLEIELAVANPGDSAFSFTAALHTYFGAKDIGRIALHGLGGIEYRDAANGNVIATETGETLVIRGEVDRVFHAVRQPIVLVEDERRLAVRNEGFPDAVVWNPGERLCASLGDMAPDGFRRMLCIEAAVVRVPVTVEPGGTWSGRQILALE